MLDKVVAFIDSIGIPIQKGKVPKSSFLPNIAIKRGGIVYNDEVCTADILHEAGHLAIIPLQYRDICSGDMDKSAQKIWNKAQKNGHMEIDTPIFRQLIQASECEAIAWSWAAGKYIGLADEEIITDDPRHFNGEGEEIREYLSLNSHFGINGLRAGGMLDSVKSYPQLTRWVQP